MVARLVKRRQGKICCSNCMIEQHEIKSVCWFCGATFTNWESFIVQAFEDSNISN